MGKRTTQLNEITTIDDNDILYGVDVDDLTHSPDGTSVRFKKSNLLKEVNSRAEDIESDVSELQGIISGLLDWFYPIGTIYETTSSDLDTTTKMNNHFGGTWEVYGAGRVLVAKSADTEFDTIGETGGQKTTRHAYPITPLNSSKFQDPGNTYWASVRGDINSYLTGGGSSSVSPQTAIRGVGGEIRTTGTTATEVTYDRYTATNLQPYIVVYRYRRIA